MQDGFKSLKKRWLYPPPEEEAISLSFRETLLQPLWPTNLSLRISSRPKDPEVEEASL